MKILNFNNFILTKLKITKIKLQKEYKKQDKST